MKKTPQKSDFASFSFSSKIFSAIQAAGYKEPTDVQEEAIPAILEGKDVLARAETGSGKTAAFVLPLLEGIIRRNFKLSAILSKKTGSTDRTFNKKNVVDVVVLVPTRELAIQIREEFERFAEGVEPRIKCLSVYGGVKINPQMLALRGGADVLISTPGRLLDLERNNAILLHQVRTLVVDEVDRLMKGDFEEEMDAIFKLMPGKRQNLMFTATFPGSIRKLVRRVMNEPEIINVDDLYDDAAIKQRVFTVNHDKKNDLLAHLLKENDWKQVLVFCSAKRSCDNLVRKLEKRDVTAVAMHGNLQQNARARALSDFKEGKTRVLIATDVAGRGIDIGQLPCVINYELPRSPNDYTHRIGRTGRAGEQGMAISLISHNEYQHFTVIEKRAGVQLEREQVEGLEADKKAPEPPARTQPKKKAKGKKRKVLVDKKIASQKNKLETKKEEDRIESVARKEKFRGKAISERNAEKEKRANDAKYAEQEPTKPASGSFYGKPPKANADKPKIDTETESIKPPASGSFYGKPPKADTDKPKTDASAPSTPKSERVAFDSAPSPKAPKEDKSDSGTSSLYTRKLPKDGDA
jgi:superfamily II DNA/RNA helicase